MIEKLLTCINNCALSIVSIFSKPVIGTDKSIIVSCCTVTVSQLKHFVDDTVTPSKSSAKKSNAILLTAACLSAAVGPLIVQFDIVVFVDTPSPLDNFLAANKSTVVVVVVASIPLLSLCCCCCCVDLIFLRKNPKLLAFGGG